MKPAGNTRVWRKNGRPAHRDVPATRRPQKRAGAGMHPAPALNVNGPGSPRGSFQTFMAPVTAGATPNHLLGITSGEISNA